MCPTLGPKYDLSATLVRRCSPFVDRHPLAAVSQRAGYPFADLKGCERYSLGRLVQSYRRTQTYGYVYVYAGRLTNTMRQTIDFLSGYVSPYRTKAV